MKVHNSLLVLGLALFPALPVLVQCAHSDDQEDDEDLAGEDESAGDEANAEEDATEEASQQEASPAEDTAAEPGPASEGGGDDFAVMLAAMQEQQKKSGAAMPVGKTKNNKKTAAQATSTAAATTVAGPQPMWVFVDKTWVFSTPDTTGPKVKALKYGDRVDVAAADNGWVRLTDNQYVRAKDLTDRKSKFGSQVLDQTAGQPVANGGHKVKSEILAVRNAPSLTARVVGYRKQNETVAVVKDEHGWSQIGPGQFVRSKYLFSGVEPAIGTGDQVFVVKTQSLYIRTKPDLESSVVGVVLEGNKVRVSETKDGWSRIGPNRFIRSKHLEPLAH